MVDSLPGGFKSFEVRRTTHGVESEDENAAPITDKHQRERELNQTNFFLKG